MKTKNRRYSIRPSVDFSKTESLLCGRLGRIKSPERTNAMIKPRIQYSKGFTLIELLVVVAIIALVLVFAIPNFTGMTQKARISAAGKRMVQDFKQIRERALATGIVHNVTFNLTAPYGYTVTYFDSTTKSFTYDLSGATGGLLLFGCTGSVTNAPPEGSGPPPYDGIDFPPNDILTLDARGAATKGVVYITDRRENYAVGVNSLGKITLYRYANNVWH